MSLHRFKSTFCTTLLTASALCLAGCESAIFYEPSAISESRIEVQESDYQKRIPVRDVNEAFLSDLARHYRRFGASEMQVVVTYDPKSYRNTAMNATDKAASAVVALREFGVETVGAGILPVHNQGDDAQFLVSYTSLSAHAPKGCHSLLPGVKGVSAEPDFDYKMGCTIDTMLAKQISKPSDLLGKGNVDPTTDGRASSNIVAGYRSGAQNESLDGETASGN